MRKILLSGLFTCFLVGIIFFFFRFILVDVLSPLFRPLILFLTAKEFLVIPLTIVFTFVVILVIGWLITRIKLQDIFNKYIQRRAMNLGHARGALVNVGPDKYLLAIVIKEIEFKNVNNETGRYYVLYAPQAPLPWTGLPLLVVAKDKVHLLKLSYGTLYSMVGSFGGNTPDLLTEIKS